MRRHKTPSLATYGARTASMQMDGGGCGIWRRRMNSYSYTMQEAELVTDSFAGRLFQRVLVVGETPKRYRIQATQRIRMPGRCRWLYAGETALVPRESIRFATSGRSE